MTKTISKVIAAIGAIGLITTVISCEKKAEDTAGANIATEVVANLASISASYAPPSLTSSAITVQADPCEGVSDFAVCQSNLIREYNRIGKEAVDATSQIVNALGQALGNLPDGAAGDSQDGKVSYSKTSTQVWSVLFRGAGNAPVTYVSINNGVYIVKHDKNVDEDAPAPQQIEITVNFTTSETWDVDVYFSNTTCDALAPAEPTKARLKVGLTNNLWTGKAMVYTPRWKAPGTTVTCSTEQPLAMYTDYVGNSTSSKASLYLIPGNNNDLSSIGNLELQDFCTTITPSFCGGPGEPANLNAYPNPFCSTGPNTAPTWGDSCTANTAVSGASYSSASLWVTPSALSTYTVTVPTSL